MLSGVFARKIKKLNKELRIFAGNDNSKPAGLYMVKGGRYVPVCSVDKNNVYRFTRYDNQGHIVHSGWERVLRILLTKKLIDRKKAEALFGPLSNHRPRSIIEKDRVKEAIRQVEEQQMCKHGVDDKGNAVMDKQSLLDIRDITRS